MNTSLAAILAAAFTLMSALAFAQSDPVTKNWNPPESVWQSARTTGATLTGANGGKYWITPKTMANMLDARDRLQKVSGIQPQLFIVETKQPNAFTFIAQGVTGVAYSIPYLQAIGDDLDAVATTMGHELAHLSLGHSEAQRRKRAADTQQGAKTAGAALEALGIPLGMVIGNLAGSALTTSYSRDDERAADALGLKWADAAGFDPCGHSRVVKMLAGRSSPGMPFLSTHPGYAERSDAASALAISKGGKGCD